MYSKAIQFEGQNYGKNVTNSTRFPSGAQPKSHQVLESFGWAVDIGRGRFLCGCGVVGRPIFQRDGGEIFILSTTCGHPWGVWSAIETILDMGGAA